MGKAKQYKEMSQEQPEQALEEAEPVEELGRDETRQAVYAILFASDRPLSAGRLATALGDIDPDVVLNLLAELREEIAGESVPYTLKDIAGGYQLMSKPRFAPFIRRLYQVKKSNRLSKSLLETLAIIAYRQPVTRADVEAIRGVSVSYAFDMLQEKRLIKVAGISDAPGRPTLFKTTDEFLMYFGIRTIKELPSIEELREVG